MGGEMFIDQRPLIDHQAPLGTEPNLSDDNTFAPKRSFSNLLDSSYKHSAPTEPAVFKITSFQSLEN
jgi:hypothetical protein